MLSKDRIPFRRINFLIAALCALGFTFIAFEWQSTDIVVKDLYDGQIIGDYVEQDIPIVNLEKKKQQMIKPPPVQRLDLFTVVEEFFEPEDNLDIIDEMVPTESTPDESDLFEDPLGNTGEVPEDIPLVIVEKMPEFPGGEQALLRYLSSQVNYPGIAQRANIQGTVVIKFVVAYDGSIRDAQVIKSIDPALDKEALRVVKGMPRWKPGQQQGRKVSVYFTIPVKFVLQ